MKTSTKIETWNEFWKNYTKQIYSNLIVIETIKRINPNKIIEIGAGSGTDVIVLHKLKFDITYSDFSEIALKKFKDRNPNIKAVKCDICNMPFADNSFDLVFSLGLLEHFNEKDRKKAIKEMFRISKKYVLIDVPQKFSPRVIYKKILIFLNKWPFGKEIEFSYHQLVREIKYLIKDIKVIERYGRNFLIFLRGEFQEKIYSNIIKPFGLEKIFIYSHRLFWWGWAENIGIVFEKK